MLDRHGGPDRTAWPDRRTTTRFVLRLFGALAACLVPWPGLGRAVASVFNATGNAVLAEHIFATRIALHFEWSPSDIGPRAHADWHSIVRVWNVENGLSTRFAINTRSLLYLPTSVFISLVVASLLWRRARGWRALAIGSAMLAAFLALSVALPITKFLSDPRIQAIALDGGVRSTLEAAFNAWVVPPGMSYAVPGLIWLCAMWISRPLVVAETSHGRPGMDQVKPA